MAAARPNHGRRRSPSHVAERSGGLVARSTVQALPGGCGTGEDQTTSLIMRDCALPDHTMGAASCLIFFFALLFPLKCLGQSPSGGRSDGPLPPRMRAVTRTCGVLPASKRRRNLRVSLARGSCRTAPRFEVKPSRSDGSDVGCLVGGSSKTDLNPTATHRAQA